MDVNGLKKSLTHAGVSYVWLGQSTMRITTPGGRVIYTDPVLLDPGATKADLILISHHHVDHCLPEFITPVRTPSTKLGAYHESYLKHCVHDIKGVRTLKIGESVDFDGIIVTAVEAYTPRGFHSRGEGCGFIIETSGQRIYFSGDTASTPEMLKLKDLHIDVAIVAICDNTYNINPEEICGAILKIKPRVFIPVHYTPPLEPDPVVKGGILSTRDPRFFTRKEDPGKLLPLFKGSGVEVAVLKNLVSPG